MTMQAEASSPDIQVLRYQDNAIRWDYIRAVAGLCFTLGPILVVPDIHGGFLVVLGGLALLFLAFGIRTWLRHRTRVTVTETGIALVDTRRRQLDWADVEQVKLAYFSTRRDRSEGWMQLTLSGGGTSLSVDSPLERFLDLAAEAAQLARAKGMALDDASIRNFESLGQHGLRPDDPFAKDR
ncbi:MAG: hypothetical protein KJ904_16190 [Alphaproteobacteria bacterium]|nr:hypothetical protein [Alphaproteobacteria bacterium]MBU0796778.1 hypothetical protein [Alphaproteobacteria bacterium]MBU0888696.1 hypothetical protein [Alphaproteobacteria bacterium]MBU1813570.1 hypothetical protein [Alphaproteobacteria bacterium]